jgi:hypothetical protein
MPRFLLHHRHRPADCAVAFAAWRGFDSPLRGTAVLASCVAGGHLVCWQVDADGPEAALEMLPPYVARRTEAIEVREVQLP